MVTRWIRGHQVATFLAVTFGWTWGWYALFFVLDARDVLVTIAVPAVWGPLVGAIAIAWASETSLRSWFAHRLTWRVHPAWYLLAVSIPLLISNAQPLLEAAGGGTVTYDPPAAVHLMALWVLANAFVWGGTEEIGWRGILQPRLQSQTSVLTAGIVIGVIWWGWHLPWFFSGNPAFSLEPWAFAGYGVFITGVSTVLAALVNATDGSVLPAMVMHGTANLGAVLAASGGYLTGSPIMPVVGGSLWWIVTTILVIKHGRSMVPNPTLSTRA